MEYRPLGRTGVQVSAGKITHAQLARDTGR